MIRYHEIDGYIFSITDIGKVEKQEMFLQEMVLLREFQAKIVVPFGCVDGSQDLEKWVYFPFRAPDSFDKLIKDQLYELLHDHVLELLTQHNFFDQTHWKEKSFRREIMQATFKKLTSNYAQI